MSKKRDVAKSSSFGDGGTSGNRHKDHPALLVGISSCCCRPSLLDFHSLLDIDRGPSLQWSMLETEIVGEKESKRQPEG